MFVKNSTRSQVEPIYITVELVTSVPINLYQHVPVEHIPIP